MDKQAFLDSLTPAQAAIAALLIGGGGFSAGRIGQELVNKMSPPAPKDKGLTLDVPVEHPQKQAQEDNAFQDNLNRMILFGGGLPIGFLGMKSLYDHMKGTQSKSEIDTAKQKYLQTLQSTKVGNDETPVLDGFITAFYKQAESDPGFGANAYDQAKSQILSSDLSSRATNYLTGGLGHNVGTSLSMLALLTTALTGGAFMAADKNKEDSQSSRTYPTQVSINEIPMHQTKQPNTNKQPGVK